MTLKINTLNKITHFKWCVIKQDFYSTKRIIMSNTVKHSGIVVDKRLVRFLTLTEWDGGIYSAYLSDIDESFWFSDKALLQEFLNRQSHERFEHPELRKGYFEYTNECGSRLRYHIKELNRGKIVSFVEEPLI